MTECEYFTARDLPGWPSGTQVSKLACRVWMVGDGSNEKPRIVLGEEDMNVAIHDGWIVSTKKRIELKSAGSGMVHKSVPSEFTSAEIRAMEAAINGETLSRDAAIRVVDGLLEDISIPMKPAELREKAIGYINDELLNRNI
jgi:hypothetical protein